MTRTLVETNPAFNLPVDTVYYIESAHNTKLNDFVQQNKAEIEKLFAKSTLLDYKLVYIRRNNWQNAQLQHLLQLKFPEKTQAEIEVLQTNILSKNEGNDQKISDIKPTRQQLTSNSDIRFNGINLMCRLLPTMGENDKYSFLTMDLETVAIEKSYDEIANFLRKLDQKNNITLFPQQKKGIVNFRVAPRSKSSSIDRIVCKADSQKLEILILCDDSAIEKSSVEDDLRQKAQKIRDEIAAMQRENGINILVEILGDDLLATLKKLHPATLSRIIVDENLNLFLPDYQNKEVKMNALSKTLYCLFLLHHEGIRIKEISDYKSELLTIYKLISNRENLNTLTKSIDELCDPLSNSINEKLSRIRKAFCDIMVSDLAQEYIPDGPRGKAKRICLDRDLVFLPQILKSIAK